MPRGTNRRAPRRGWIVFEVVGAMFIITVLAGILILAEFQQRKTMAELSDSRAASRAAEAVLTAMRSGQVALATDDNVRIAVKSLGSAADAPQMAWVEVTATISRHGASVVGLVPKSAVAVADAGSAVAQPAKFPGGVP